MLGRPLWQIVGLDNQVRFLGKVISSQPTILSDELHPRIPLGGLADIKKSIVLSLRNLYLCSPFSIVAKIYPI